MSGFLFCKRLQSESANCWGSALSIFTDTGDARRKDLATLMEEARRASHSLQSFIQRVDNIQVILAR